jgi:periplasmic protein TonB
MITAGPHRSRVQKGAHVQGWLVSVLLHGTVTFAAILLMQKIHLAPQNEPFTWNVAMMAPAQSVQPAATSLAQTPRLLRSPTDPVPSPSLQQTAPAQGLPSSEPPARQTRPSRSERSVTPVMTESSAPPLRPTTPSQSIVHTRPPTEPIRQETVAPIAAESTSVVKPDEAPLTAAEESTARTGPPSAPLRSIEHTAQIDETPAPMQMAAISPPRISPTSTRDYGWLSETILRRVEELKRYPASARMDRAEGKVVVKAVINEDGSIGEAEVFLSSGHLGLDKAALETLRQAAPFSLPRPLGKPGMTIKIPMSYRLDR